MLVHLDGLIAGLGVRLSEVDAELTRLDRRVATLRRDRTALVEQRTMLARRRTTFADSLERMRLETAAAVARTAAATATPPAASTAAPPAVSPVVPAPRPSSPAPPPQVPPAREPGPEPDPGPAHDAREEASALSVQAVLLTLGGLLLGVAAITFTAVAWTTFGPAGRAAILGTVTVVALLVPWLLARRGLAATAETISAVALLLVALDGYAAWSVGLFGVDRVASPPSYAGAVFLVTALVAAGYRVVAPLVVPRYVAVLAAQPVLPLVVIGAASGSGGGSSDGGFPVPGSESGTAALAAVGILAAAVAAQNLAIVAAGRRSGAAPAGVRALVWTLVAATLGPAWLAAVLAAIPAPTAALAALAGLALVVVASVSLAAAVVVGRAWARAVAGAAGAVAVLLAAGIPAAHLMPAADAAFLVPFAVLVLGAAYGIRSVPAPWRAGVTAGVGGFATVLATAAGGTALVAALGVLPDAVWATDPDARTGWGFALPATLALLAGAATALRDRDRRHHLAVAALAAAGLATAAAPGGPTGWTAPLISVAAALAFALAALKPGIGRHVAARGVAAGVLALHAIAAGLASRWSTAVVLGALVAGGAALAVRARRRPDALATWYAGTALAALPGAVTAGAALLLPSTVDLRPIALVTAALVVTAAGMAAVRHGTPHLPVAAGAAAGAVSVLGVGGLDDLLGLLVAGLAPVAALIGVSGALAARRDPAQPALSAVFLAGGLAATVATVARAASIALPGTGMVAAAAATALLGGVAAVAPRRWRDAAAGGATLVGAALAVVALPVAGAAGTAATLSSVSAPWSADLSGWPDLADRVAVFGWQGPATLALLTVAVLALGRRTDFVPYRDAAALIGGAAVVVATPAALGLPWWAPMVLSGAAALALALTATRLRGDRELLFTAAVAAGLGAHAAVVSLARAESTAIVLGATVAGCLLVAATARVARLRDAAVGGALAALPGAAAATAATLSARPALVLSLGLATASLALGVASVIGLARRAEAPAAGAVAGALACVAVAMVVPSATGWDYLTATLLLIGALARISRRHRESRGAGGATLALIAEMSQLVALLVPGAPLVTTAVVVAAVALAVRRLPAQWRPGPTAGLALACAALALAAAAVTVLDAAAALVALAPGADLAAWQSFEPAGVQLLGWQPAVALLILAGTAAAFSRRRPGTTEPAGWGDPARATAFAVTAVALAAVHAPLGFGLPWWAPSTVAGLAALGLGVLATRLPVRWTGLLAAALAAGSGAYAGAAALARPAGTAIVLCGLIAAGSVVAVIAVRAAGPAARPTGHGAVVVATVLMPVTGVAGTRALDLAVSAPHVALLGAALALGGALAARRRYPHAGLAGVALAVATTLVLPPFGPTPVHIAVAALIGVAAGLRLPPRTSDGRRPALGGLIPAALPLAVMAGIAAPAVLLVLATPYGWLGRPWSAHPADSWLGLMPGSADWTEPGPALIPPGLALTTLAVGLLVRFTTARRWLVPAVLPGAAATVLVAPATLELGWPAGVAAAALVAVTAGVGASLVGRGAPAPARLAVAMSGALAVGAGGAALAGAAATRATTYATLGIAVLAGAAAGWFGRRPGARTAGWLVASVAGLVGATAAAGDRAGVPLALGPFVAAVALLGAAALLESRDRRPGEVVPVEVVAHVAAAGALATATTLRQAALVLVGYGAALGLSALRPRRRGYAIVAGAAELLAWWMLLFTAEVGVIEAYTLPFALVALVGGVVGLRTRPGLRSWVAYGPALAAAFLPSLALVLATSGEPLRRLMLGAGAIVVVVAGGARRRQAPVLVGAAVLVLVTLHELVVWWDLLPRWIPLAVGGLLLVSVGATYERRRRDLRTLRTAVGGMR